MKNLLNPDDFKETLEDPESLANLIQVLKERNNKRLKDANNTKAELIRKLYYNEDSKPLQYTIEDLPGNYIEITALEFASARYDVIVKDGKLTYPEYKTFQKLTPTSDKGTKCYKDDVSIIGNGQHWALTEYK
jgi:hypothetical protein